MIALLIREIRLLSDYPKVRVCDHNAPALHGQADRRHSHGNSGVTYFML